VSRKGLFAASFVLLLAPFCQAADTIAVLPLFNQNEAKSPNLDWIGESVAETIHESLSSVGLLVLDREDREEVYRRLTLRTGVVLTRASVIKVGQTLDAGLVIFGEFHVDSPDGTVSTGKSNLKLTVHIIDLKHFGSGPEFSQEGPLETLSQMQTKLAWMVAHRLAPDGTPGEEAFIHDRPPVKVEAVESYIRGLIASNPDQKAKLFAQAVKIDDLYSAPNFQLGRIAFQRKDYKAASAWLAKVSKGDSHYLEAAFLRGIGQYYAGNFDDAANLFRMVSAEVPLNEVFNNLGAALSRKNDSGANENFTKALEGDPADPDYWFNVGYSIWKSGQYALAAEKFRAVLDRSPGDQEATTMLGRCIKMDGPRAGDPRSEGRERIKTTFEDSAYRQLQAELRNKQSP
jgi:TolA-binding protein